MTRMEHELHSIEQALEVIEHRMAQMARDKIALLERRREILQHQRGEHQPPLEGWDVT